MTRSRCPSPVSTVRKQIAAGETGPLYLLVGADDVEKSAVAHEFAGIVEEGLEAFNIDRLYGAETSVDALIDSARTLPDDGVRVVSSSCSRRRSCSSRSARARRPRRSRSGSRRSCKHRRRTRRGLRLWSARHAPTSGQAAAEGSGQVVDCGTIDDEADAERWVKAARRATSCRSMRVPCGHWWSVPGLIWCGCAPVSSGVALYALGQPSITAEDVAAGGAGRAGRAGGLRRGQGHLAQRRQKSALRELALAHGRRHDTRDDDGTAPRGSGEAAGGRGSERRSTRCCAPTWR